MIIFYIVALIALELALDVRHLEVRSQVYQSAECLATLWTRKRFTRALNAWDSSPLSLQTHINGGHTNICRG